MGKISKKDVTEAENQLFLAQLTSNVDILDQLLYDHLIAVTPTGQILTKEMDLNAHRSKSMIIEEASTAIDDISIVGDTALTIVTMIAKGKVMDTPLEGKFRYFRIWKYVDAKLKVIGASFIQLPE
ncbi:MAG: nuclear transport factor 2 family protein [Sphingobacterium sp.]|jgi:hypothetical protein|nr:nuclear transport factor 2 family protein [Sphingobacterium sp.]